MPKAKKVRINIDVDQSKLDEIKRLMEIAGVSTQRELFDNALTIAKWMMRKRKEGKSVGALSDDDRFTELDMPMLENAEASSAEV